MSKSVFTKSILVLVALTVALFTLASCQMLGFDAQQEETKETEDTAEALVTPAEVAGDIDLTAKDPSNDNIKFYFDKEGRIESCEYKKDDVTYLVSYTYTGRKICVFNFGNDTVVDYREFKVYKDFDPAVGFVMSKGYYFNGFSSIRPIKVTLPETGGDETTDTAESVTDTAPESAESESAAQTDSVTTG